MNELKIELIYRIGSFIKGICAMRLHEIVRTLALLWILIGCHPLSASESLEWHRDIVPILNRYCTGCHNNDDLEGDLSLESYSNLLQPSKEGPLVQPGNTAASRLLGVVMGTKDPQMPPEDQTQPSQREIDLLQRWVATGAKINESLVDTNQQPRRGLTTPQLAPSLTPKPITSMAFSTDGKVLAVARFRNVDLVTAKDHRFIQQLSDHPGKVNDLRFSADGGYLIAATGIAGLSGEAQIWDVRTGQRVRRFPGHRDVLYAAVASGDGKLLATAGYDRIVILWDLRDGKKLREFKGHNGPIYDLAFSFDGRVLASASADSTVKIWKVDSGERLDTLSQPLKAQNSVDISPDGRFVIAGGEDNRIRLWRLLSIEKPRINPLILARFAHEKSIERVRFTADGQQVVSLAGDRKLKIWNATDLTQQQTMNAGSGFSQAFALRRDRPQVAVGGMDGGMLVREFLTTGPEGDQPRQNVSTSRLRVSASQAVEEVAELETNDQVGSAQPVQVPCRIQGTIWSQAGTSDVDLFRFVAKGGDRLVIETRASRDKSPLDTRIAVLNQAGEPIPRVQMRAVRDSYFTFRGKNSMQTGDFRLHNWEEMELNQYLYASGEIVKLYHYPRGPDSGFNVYPNFGRRHTFFDTTSITHALHEPCYVVEPFAPNAKLPPNGLPTFIVNYENDDESRGRYGKDSYLQFEAPHDGEYIVRVEDVRGLQGEAFKYQLSLRRPQPDFTVSISGANPSVPQGAGRKFGVELQRIDGFDGEVHVSINQLPPGFSVSQPIVIQAGQLRAWGTILASPDAELNDLELAKQSRVTATGIVNGKSVTKEVGSLGEIKLEDTPKLLVHFSADGEDAELPVIEIQAGTTTTAHIRIDRQGHTGRVGFGSEEAVVNSPHGVYVDNIGLNGVLITESQRERTIFISAEPWVEEMERLVFIEANAGGRPTSQPVLLRVVANQDSLAPDSNRLGVAQE